MFLFFGFFCFFFKFDCGPQVSFPRSLTKMLLSKMQSKIITEFCKLVHMYRKSAFSKNFCVSFDNLSKLRIFALELAVRSSGLRQKEFYIYKMIN